jgi:large subunit ribosomal protein L10
MLKRVEKEAIVDRLRSDFDKARAVFLTNLIGVTSNDAVRIRKEVRDQNGNIAITRNTLMKRAAEGTPYEEMVKEIKGTNALAFAFEDAAGIAKSLNDAGKELDHVELKAGILEGKLLSKEELIQLATLPGKDQMLATLLATFQAPVSAFARVLHAIKEQKESGAEPVATEETTEEKTEE